MGTLFDNKEPSIADYWPSMSQDERNAIILELQVEHRKMQREKLGFEDNRKVFTPYV